MVELRGVMLQFGEIEGEKNNNLHCLLHCVVTCSLVKLNFWAPGAMVCREFGNCFCIYIFII